MRLADGSDSLRIEATMPDTAEARDIAELVRAKVLTGLSIEFRADAEEWQGEHRVVTGATMTAIGIVDKPAYGESALEARWRAAQCRTETFCWPHSPVASPLRRWAETHLHVPDGDGPRGGRALQGHCRARGATCWTRWTIRVPDSKSRCGAACKVREVRQR